jgi:hypothetical protein
MAAGLTFINAIDGDGLVKKMKTYKENGTDIHSSVVSLYPGTLKKSAFGEVLFAEKTPIFQATFADNLIRSKYWDTITVGGSVTADKRMAVLQTSAAANSYAIMRSRIPVKYNAGQGGEAEFTAIFDTPVAGNLQEIGIGDLQSGLFFGFQGTTFGTIRRSPANSRAAISSITRIGQVATITTTAPHGKITGDLVEISGTSATPLAENDYIGAYVITVTGASTFTVVLTTIPAATSATTPATGTFKFDSIVDSFNPLATWSDDVQDGSGISGQTLVKTNGNVYGVSFQYLGFGMFDFQIEIKETGKLESADRGKYANTNTVPSLGNPTLPLWACVRNVANTSNITLKTASMAGFVQGKNAELSVDSFNFRSSVSGITSTELPILSIKNKRAFNGEMNKVRCKLKNVSLFADGTGTNPITVRVLKNATVTGQSFIDRDTLNSVCAISTTGTTVSGGEEVFAMTFARVTNILLHEADLDQYLHLRCISLSQNEN